MPRRVLPLQAAYNSRTFFSFLLSSLHSLYLFVPEQPLSLQQELTTVWRYKWWVAGATLGAMLLAFVFTLPVFMDPEYVSHVAMVPPSFQDVKSLNYRPDRFMGVGSAEDEDLEQLTQALGSDSVMYKMANRFDLWTLYEVPGTDDPNRRYKALRREFEGHITVRGSKYSTVEVEVYDKNPERARAIAQAYLEEADAFAERIAQRRQGLTSVEARIAEFDSTIEVLSDSARILRTRYGIYMLPNLADPTAQQILGRFQNPDFAQHYDTFSNLEFLTDNLIKLRADLYEERQQRRAHLEAHPSLISVVVHPVANYDVVRPKRVVNMLLAGVGGLLFSIFAALLVQRVLDRRQAQRA
jgi:uncharacterized protein involved in exopolysaccharide biosynthesis